MAIQFVGGVVGGRAGNTATVDVPLTSLTGGIDTQPRVGDLVIAYCAVGTASGYNTIGGLSAFDYSAPQGTFINNTSATNWTYSQTSYRYMIEGTPLTNVSFFSSGHARNAQAWIVLVFRGAANVFSFATATGSGTGRPNPPAVTPTTSGSWILWFGASAAAAGASYTAPTDFATDWFTTTIADTYDVMVGGGYYSGWTSGQYDPAAITAGGTTNTADTWNAHTVIIVPGASSQTSTASLSAAIRQARTATTSLSSAIRAARSATATLSGYVDPSIFRAASINAAISSAQARSASLSAALRAARSAATDLQAVIVASMSESIGVDAAVAETRSAAVELSAAIRYGVAASASLDASIRATDPRYARPDSDLSTGLWVPSSGSTLWEMLDEETPDDGDYISTTGASTCVVHFSGVEDPGTSSGQVLYYRAQSTTGATLTARLYQGETLIATRTHVGVSSDWTTYSMTLSPAEADSITDYAALRVALEAS